ncbi:MAG: hypothetical protein ACPGU1_15880 [Myxococcota bacterium]
MCLSRSLTVFILSVALGGLSGCGGKVEAPKAPAATPAAAPAAAPAAPGKSLASLEESRVTELGQRLFSVNGGNTCNDCHGMTGHNGRLKQAADLRKPTTWKAYAATGGDGAKLKAHIIELIRTGAGPWNAAHPELQYDVNMLGVSQGATKVALRKIRKELKKEDGIKITMDEALDFGAMATYAYVQTLWEEDLTKPAPAPAADTPPPAKEGDKAPTKGS